MASWHYDGFTSLSVCLCCTFFTSCLHLHKAHFYSFTPKVYNNYSLCCFYVPGFISFCFVDQLKSAVRLSLQCCLSVALGIVRAVCVLRRWPLQNPLVKSEVCFETTWADVLISLKKRKEFWDVPLQDSFGSSPVRGGLKWNGIRLMCTRQKAGPAHPRMFSTYIITFTVTLMCVFLGFCPIVFC